MSFNFKKGFSLFFLVCLMAMLPLFWAGAQAVEGEFTNPLIADSFAELIEGIIDWVAMIGVIIAVGMIVYSGILFMTAGGDKEKITTARKALVWSLVGLAVLLIGSNWISIIKDLLGGTVE